MITADYKVVLDTCVLANFTVCDLFLRLAESPRQYIPLWSDEILSETHRTHIDKLGWPSHIADSFRGKLLDKFPASEVLGYKQLIKSMTNDPKDRHVLAAAVVGGSESIVTFNLKDFQESALEPFGIWAVHPQDFATSLYKLNGLQFVRRLTDIAAARKTDIEEVVINLGKYLPKMASRLYVDLEL